MNPVNLEPEMLSNKLRKHPEAMSSFCLDLELETQEKPELRNQIPETGGQSPKMTCTETRLLQSDASSTSKDESEFYSLDSIQMDDARYYDASIIQCGKPEIGNSLLAFNGSSSTRNIPSDPLEENGGHTRCQNDMVNDCENDVDNNQAGPSFGDQRDSAHRIMKEDKSIPVCMSRNGDKKPASVVNSGLVTTMYEPPIGNSKTGKAAQALMKKSTAEKDTSPMPPAPTRDIMVGTELPECVLAFTQTEDQATADKHVITEVHMSDLDYLSEEFKKLYKAAEQLKKQKARKNGCDCIQRAQQAELSLLALQYSMCRQHCWRLYYTSAEGAQLSTVHGDLNLHWPMDPPANVLSVLQKLEYDYNRMREKILAGVPLEQLKPLSIESDKIITGASYIPTQIIGNMLENTSSRSSQQAQKHTKLSELAGYSDAQEGSCCHNDQRKKNPPNQLTKDSCTPERDVSPVPQTRDFIDKAHKPEEKQTTVCKELNLNEAWYDAEEDLESAVSAEVGLESKDERAVVGTKPASKETKSSVLCVSNLPSIVTESDVMLWFEKYHVSEVSISTLKNDLRFAFVVVSDHRSAESAVTDLNGCIRQGHTLNVEHIDRAAAGSHSQASTSTRWTESSQNASNTDSSSTLTRPLLGSSIKNRKVVCTSPTAKETFVPDHYGTMGSFDTLMAELTRHHPDIQRQRIVDALIELRTQHQGVLSGLPLSTIRMMTSELLTRPGGATQL